MRIDVDRMLWVVTDPGPRSELGDVCFRTNLAGLALQARGGLDVEAAHATIYLLEGPARRDARDRLEARRVYETLLEAARLKEAPVLSEDPHDYYCSECGQSPRAEGKAKCAHCAGTL